MKLFVANCSAQKHLFVYRVPETNRQKIQEIPEGGQIIVWRDDATQEVLAAILAQHEVYGLVDVKSIDQTARFIGLCYSWNQPVRVEKIMAANESNEGHTNAAGLEVRKTSAASINRTVQDHIQNVPLRTLSVEVTEEGKSASNPGASETIVVQTSSEGRAPPKRARGRAR